MGLDLGGRGYNGRGRVGANVENGRGTVGAKVENGNEDYRLSMDWIAMIEKCYTTLSDESCMEEERKESRGRGSIYVTECPSQPAPSGLR